MEFINKLTEKLSFSKKGETPSAPVVRIPGFLDQLNDNKAQFETTLINIKKISPDSYIYTYSLPNPDLPLGLLPGHHVVVYGDINGDHVKREYTPISDFNRKGSFDLLVKVYRANVHPDFPRGGKLTQYLETVKVGDKVIMSGPKFKKTYLGHGKLNWKGVEYNVKEIGMIAGGTGIAPMYQVIRALLDDPTDQTKLHLLFANRSEADILMREELEKAAKDPRIKLHYVVDQGSSAWKGFTGYITKEMLQKTMPKPSNDLLLWACGPKPMHRLVKSQFQDLGYNMDNAMM